MGIAAHNMRRRIRQRLRKEQEKLAAVVAEKPKAEKPKAEKVAETPVAKVEDIEATSFEEAKESFSGTDGQVDDDGSEEKAVKKLTKTRKNK